MPFPRFTLRTLLVVVAVCAVISGAAAFVYRQWPNNVTQAEIQQLTPGMTMPEVRAILGAPDGIYEDPPRDGKLRETWAYGVWNWLVEFEDGRFTQAYLF